MKKKTFTNGTFGELTVILTEKTLYFPAHYVAETLGFGNPKKTIERHTKDWQTFKVATCGGEQNIKHISEDDVYALILRSKGKIGTDFYDWVREEIRPTFGMSKSKSKGDYNDIIESYERPIRTGRLAIDYGISSRKLNAILSDLGFQHKSGKDWIINDEYSAMGVNEKKTIYKDGRKIDHNYLFWNQAGVKCIYEILKEQNIFPKIEQDEEPIIFNRLTKPRRNIKKQTMKPLSVTELKKRSNWLCYNNKVEKIPINPKNGGNAKTNDPNTWDTYSEAKKALKKYDLAGVGFTFFNGIGGIDIDFKANDHDFEERRAAILELLPSYTEKSPRGIGDHIIFQYDGEKLTEKIRKKHGDKDFKEIYFMKNSNFHLECYLGGITNKYFTFTGHKINDFPINDLTDEVFEFLEKYMLKSCVKHTEKSHRPTTTLHSSVSEIIELIRRTKQREKFNMLYSGDLSKYNGDHSRADLALCDILAFYTGGDAELIEEIMNSSGLCRDKWLERKDYRDGTIRLAIDGCHAVYRGR